MAKTAEQILKAQGLADADITALLANPLMRTAIENPFNALESERDTLVTRNQEWESLHKDKWTPALSAAEDDARKARLEAAELRERVKIAKEYGYLDDDGDRKAQEAIDAAKRAALAAQPGGFNEDDPRFREFAGKFSRAEGDAIAMHGFLSEEYRLLNGGSVNDYRGADGKRGLIALRAEAQTAREPIDVYMSKKFDWDGKRREQDAKRQSEHDSEVGRKAVEEYALKHGANPMTNTPMPSRNPFVPMTAREGKQPWDNPNAKSDRLQRAYQTETKARVN